MENASKALLFAAGILIAIILISVAVYLVNMSNNATKEVGSTMSQMELSSFNSKFTTYNGRRTGSQLTQLVSVVNANNADKEGTDQIVTILDKTGGHIVSGESNTKYVSKAGSSKYYYILCQTKNGAVQNIIVSNSPITDNVEMDSSTKPKEVTDK